MGMLNNTGTGTKESEAYLGVCMIVGVSQHKRSTGQG